MSWHDPSPVGDPSARVQKLLAAVVATGLLVGCAKQEALEIERLEHRQPFAADAAATKPNVQPGPDHTDAGHDVSDGIACFTQIRAVCELNARCRRLSAPAEGCLGLARECPTAFFVPGSTRTNAGLMQCAQDYANFECEAFLRGEAPACATAGELGAGQACGGHSACQSLFCEREPAGGTTCHALAEPGGACPERTVCPAGQSCVEGSCEDIGTPTLESGNAPQSPVGGPCYETSYCQEGLYCWFEEPTATGVCRVPPRPPEACATERAYSAIEAHAQVCSPDAYCLEGYCTPLPAIGEPCATRVDSVPVTCALGGTCDPDSARCVPWRAPGEACTLPRAFSTATGRALGPECDEEVFARCLCDEGQDSCDDPLCRVALEPGQACDLPYARCLYGSHCLDGVCDYAPP